MNPILNLKFTEFKLKLMQRLLHIVHLKEVQRQKHTEKVFKEMDKAFGTKNVANVMLDRSVKGNKILGDELRKMLIALQFTRYV